MLANQAFYGRKRRLGAFSEESGVVLLIALIMLVAMTLAGIALVRSVYGTNMVAGNLAFQQAATSSADAGAEDAITWLQANNTCPGNNCKLYASDFGSGYIAFQEDPSVGKTWDTYWNELKNAGRVRTLAKDASGNTTSYVIHRLCANTGDKDAAAPCAMPPAIAASGQGNNNIDQLQVDVPTTLLFYRVTTRVAGPRNTVSYVQTVVALPWPT